MLLSDKPKRKEKKRNADGETEPEEEPLPVVPDESKWDIVYCLPFFAKPGKHSYMVKVKDPNELKQKQLLKRRKKLHELLVSEEQTDSKRFYEQSLWEIDFELKPEVFFYNCQVIERTEPVPVSKYLELLTI